MFYRVPSFYKKSNPRTQKTLSVRLVYTFEGTAEKRKGINC